MPNNDFGEHRRTCLKCRQVKLKTEFADQRYCVSCIPEVRKAKYQKEKMADQRSIAKACREFTSAMNATRQQNDTHDMPVILERFKQKIGGNEKLADILVEDFQKARGENLSEEEKARYNRSDFLILKYHQMLLQAFSNADRFKAEYDLEAVDEQDLKACLIDLAVEMITDNAEFREVVMRQAIEQDPELLRKIIREAGTDVIDSENEAELIKTQ